MALKPLSVADTANLNTPGLPEGFTVNPVAKERNDSVGTIAAAAFRQHNPLTSIATSDTLWTSNEVDPEFDLESSLAGTEFEDQPELFLDTHNPRMFEARRAQILREQEDRRVLQSGGWTGAGLTFAAAVLSPENLIPGGMVVRGSKLGYSMAKSSVGLGLVSAGSAVAAEGVLHASQEVRTIEESLMGIISAGIVGGALGAGFAYRGNVKIKNNIASRVDLAARVSDEYAEKVKAGTDPAEDLLVEAEAILKSTDGQPGSMGAAARDVPTLEDLSVAGKAAGYLHKKTAFLNPVLRMFNSASPAARDIAQNLFEVPIYMKMNEYSSSATAVETIVKTYNSRVASLVDETGTQTRVDGGKFEGSTFSRMRQAGVNMTRQEYRDAVGRAMRTGDAGENEFITEAAQKWRNELFEPMREELNKVGFDIDSSSSTTAQTYLPRVWNTIKLLEGEGDFKRITEDWMRGELEGALEAQARKLDKKIGNINSEIDELTDAKLRRSSALDEKLNNIDPTLTRDEVQSMMNVYRAGPPKEPETLIQFLAKRGGLVDYEGQIKQLGIKRVGFIRKHAASDMHPTGGMDLDAAARLAWEEGFLRGSGRPEINDLLDALADEASGYRPIVRAVDEEAGEALENYRMIEGELARYNIDVKNPRFGEGVDDADIMRALNKAQDNLADQRITRLRSKIDDLEEAHRADRMITKSSDEFDEWEFNREVRDIVDSIFNKLTGREEIGHFNEHIPATKGPLKNKTFRIPDKFIQQFLEDDIELIGRRYSRLVGGQVEMKRKFGSLHLKDYFQKITDEYKAAREELFKDPELSVADRNKMLKQLEKQEKGDKRDLSFARDKILGLYKHDTEINGFTRTADLAMSFNYMRALGGVLVTSSTDVFRPMMVHGMGRVFGEAGIQALTKQSRGLKMNTELARKYAGVAEITNGSRIATMADLADPHAHGSHAERFVQNMTSVFSRATGLPYWNQFMKEFSANISMDRVIGNAMKGYKKLSPSEQKYMNFLGLGRDMIDHIRLAKPEKLDGVWTLNPENMNDAARRTFFSGVTKDVDRIIVTKGLGDAPLWTSHPVGRLLFQFKGFAMATHQRVLMAGLQNDNAAFISGLAGMVTVGGLVYALKQLEAGRDLSDNPGTWLAEGMDRSGIFAVFFELNNMAEKLGAPGAYSALASTFPSRNQKQPASRFAVRSAPGSVLGPSFGLATDIAMLTAKAGNLSNPFTGQKTDFNKADAKTIRRLAPFASLPYWRWYIDREIVPYFDEK